MMIIRLKENSNLEDQLFLVLRIERYFFYGFVWKGCCEMY